MSTYQPNPNPTVWGIVLAGGEGVRMRQFIRQCYGLSSPKQYVTFTGSRSMVEHTLHRVERFIPSQRILIVVNPRHRQEIQQQLSGRPKGTVISQPSNQDTAAGILLPLVHILKKDPIAHVAIFPSDHFVLEENAFIRQVLMADRIVQGRPEETVLLGVQAEGPEVEYGWIEPTEPLNGLRLGSVRRIRRFLEKPDPETARMFFQLGFLWNTFIIVSKAITLARMAARCVPDIWRSFERIFAAVGTGSEHSVVEREYGAMRAANFSRDVLQRSPDRISVLELKGVFWSDWGNGERVLDTLRKIGKSPTTFQKNAAGEVTFPFLEGGLPATV